MRKLAEAIVGPESTVDLVLGTCFDPGRSFFIFTRQESDPLGPHRFLFPPRSGLKMRHSVIQAPRNWPPTSSRFLLCNLMVLFSCPRSSIPSSQRARSEARMIALQTKFISGTSDSQANSVPRSNTIGNHIIFACHYRIESSRSDYFFTPPSPPLISGDSVSVGPLRGPLRKSFRSLSMSGLTRKV